MVTSMEASTIAAIKEALCRFNMLVSICNPRQDSQQGLLLVMVSVLFFKTIDFPRQDTGNLIDADISDNSTNALLQQNLPQVRS